VLGRLRHLQKTHNKTKAITMIKVAEAKRMMSVRG
jgi:hypothetical protein